MPRIQRDRGGKCSYVFVSIANFKSFHPDCATALKVNERKCKCTYRSLCSRCVGERQWHLKKKLQCQWEEALIQDKKTSKQIGETFLPKFSGNLPDPAQSKNLIKIWRCCLSNLIVAKSLRQETNGPNCPNLSRTRVMERATDKQTGAGGG